MNSYSLVESALDLFPDNMHLGKEKISIVFKIEGAVTGTDDLGNNIRSSTDVIVEGRARIDSNRKQEQNLPGTNNKYLPLRINVTKVDGVATTARPSTVTSAMVGIATYTQNNGETITGQFMVQPSLDKSIAKIHEKVGDIMYGKLEVMGDGKN